MLLLLLQSQLRLLLGLPLLLPLMLAAGAAGQPLPRGPDELPPTPPAAGTPAGLL
jgi:hypothetical protein